MERLSFWRRPKDGRRRKKKCLKMQQCNQEIITMTRC